MKTIILIFSMVLSTAVFAGNNDPIQGNSPAKVESSTNGIGAAMSAIRQACPNATGKLQYTETTVSICINGGFITEVNFYKTPNCPPNQPCIQVIELVGTVTLGCDGTATGCHVDGVTPGVG